MFVIGVFPLKSFPKAAKKLSKTWSNLANSVARMTNNDNNNNNTNNAPHDNDDGIVLNTGTRIVNATSNSYNDNDSTNKQVIMALNGVTRFQFLI